MEHSDEMKKPAKSRRKYLWIGAGIVLSAAVLTIAFSVSRNRARDAAADTAASPAPTAAAEEVAEDSGPEIAYEAGYMACGNGLFRPADTLTAGEAADAVLRAGGQAVSVENADEPLTEETLAALLSGAFSEEDISEAMTAVSLHGSESITRAEAAVFFDRLFGLDAAEGETDFYPDVVPGDWGSGDIYTAASGAAAWDGEDGRPAEGTLLIDGQLYYVGEDGYFVKNAYRGTLYFDASGRYTSGDAELDGYVLAAIREATDESMTREEMLRAMYLYVRDNFTYLRRHYYKNGDVGWAASEALTMYSTGRGNCYNYASAFWAAARALGYDAKIVSGTYGEDEAPHGWVEILRDGARYTYDVELEMAVHRDNPGTNQTFYEMTDAFREAHDYREFPAVDNVLPMTMAGALQPK